MILEVFKRELPNLPGIDLDDLEDDADSMVSVIQDTFTKKVGKTIKRIEGTSKSRRKFKTLLTDSTWSEDEERGYRDVHYSYEVEYPSKVRWAVNVVMDPRKLLEDLRGEFRYFEAGPKVAEEAAKAAFSVIRPEDFLEDAASTFTKRDVHLRKDEGLEENVFDYVWDEAMEDYEVTEDGEVDELGGVQPKNIDTNIRASREVLPHPSKFGFRLEYEFSITVEIRGW
jgi:hypothetical protein